MSEIYRYEIKFVITEDKLPAVENWMTRYTDFYKSYPVRQVNSLYFDDVNFSAVKDNLAGVSDRIKNRLRWYGDDNDTDTIPVLEQKIRKGRLGRKESQAMPLLKGKVRDSKPSDIRKLIVEGCNSKNHFLEDYLTPVLHVDYSRKYFEDRLGLRITIDSNIQFIRMLNRSLSMGKKIKYSNKIIEFKFDHTMKSYVADLLRNFPLTAQRHSKYLTGLAKFNDVQYF